MSQNKKRQRIAYQEEMELDEAYYNLTGRKPKAKLNRTSVIVIAICAVLTVLAIGAVILALTWPRDGLGQVKIGSLDLSGKTQSQARDALEDLSQKYANSPMVVSVMDQVVVIPGQKVMDGLDVDAVLRDAKAATQDGQAVTLDIQQYLGIDEIALWQYLLPLENHFSTTPSKTKWNISGESPSPSDPSDPGSKKLTVTIGVPDYGLDMDKLYDMVIQGYKTQNFQVRMQCDVVEPELPNLEEIHSLTCTEPKDAVMDEKTFLITPESYGYGFDLEDAHKLLESTEYGQTVEILFQKTMPLVTQQQLEEGLYRDVLGEYKTPHIDDADRNENLRLACQAINGMVILPGQTFSYNKALGERTEARGYRPGESYVNGLTVDTIGGGICQVSSTLYYVTLLSDLQIVERSPHGYVSSYIPKGMDAAVSWGYQDFKFKNNMQTPIRIEAWMENGYVNVRIHGQEIRSYYVELVYEELSTEPYDVIYKEYPPDNKEGYTNGQIIITPYTGCRVKTYKKLIDRQTGKVMDTLFEVETRYNKRDKVICLLTEPAPSESSPETPPSP